jgi:hypothetical protein
MEYSKINHQDAVTARAIGHASANNVVKEFVQATEELVAELTDNHPKQIEALIKANNEAMTKLTAALIQSKVPSAAPAAPASATQNPSAAASKKLKRWKEKCQTATTCLHCSKIRPNHTHDQCWELETNSHKRSAGWKSAKST